MFKLVLWEKDICKCNISYPFEYNELWLPKVCQTFSIDKTSLIQTLNLRKGNLQLLFVIIRYDYWQILKFLFKNANMLLKYWFQLYEIAHIDLILMMILLTMNSILICHYFVQSILIISIFL